MKNSYKEILKALKAGKEVEVWLMKETPWSLYYRQRTVTHEGSFWDETRLSKDAPSDPCLVRGDSHIGDSTDDQAYRSCFDRNTGVPDTLIEDMEIYDYVRGFKVIHVNIYD